MAPKEHFARPFMASSIFVVDGVCRVPAERGLGALLTDRDAAQRHEFEGGACEESQQETN